MLLLVAAHVIACCCSCCCLLLLRNVAQKTMSLYYPTDSSVEADMALQKWVAAMLNPLGSNLGQINSRNEVRTRAELYDLLGQTLWMTMAHGTAHLQDWFIRMLSMAHHPLVMSTTTLPDPDGQYTLDDMMQLGPNLDQYGRWVAILLQLMGDENGVMGRVLL
jgi:hypothetical protein